jgi:hypothetical protein
MIPREDLDPDKTISPDQREPNDPNWEALEQKIERVKDDVKSFKDISEGRYDFLTQGMLRIETLVKDTRNLIVDLTRVVESNAVRLGRIDKEGDVTVLELRDLRKEFRDSKTFRPEAEYHDLTATGKARALTQKDAELMLAHQENERLKREAESDDKDREARAERSRYYTRAIFAGVVSLAVLFVGAYMVARLLTPPVPSTTIQTQGVPAK